MVICYSCSDKLLWYRSIGKHFFDWYIKSGSYASVVLLKNLLLLIKLCVRLKKITDVAKEIVAILKI